MRRREFLGLLGAAGLPAKEPPAPSVAVAKCPSYNEDLNAVLSTMFDQIGGLSGLVRGKTVTVKLNLTGSPGNRVEGRPPAVTHFSHPKMAGSLAHLLGRAGARRIRFVESCWATAGPLEEFMLDSGWNVRALKNAAAAVEFENTNALGKSKSYARFRVPGGAYIYPAYDLNKAYEETDVLVSMSKLKEHATCGVTLALKNCFGITPASIYGDDTREDEPNESPTKGRVEVLHYGKRRPPKSAPQELDPASSREAGYRVPRIVTDLAAARPIELSIIDGIETIAGGEGPWVSGVRRVQPGVLVVGTNPVTTDAVATAIMGFDPRAERGTAPFLTCDNTMRLAEAVGIGTTDLKKIEVRGVAIDAARIRFRG